VRIPIVVAVRMSNVVFFGMNAFDAAGECLVEALLTPTADHPGMIDSGRARLEAPSRSRPPSRPPGTASWEPMSTTPR